MGDDAVGLLQVGRVRDPTGEADGLHPGHLGSRNAVTAVLNHDATPGVAPSWSAPYRKRSGSDVPRSTSPTLQIPHLQKSL